MVHHANALALRIARERVATNVVLPFDGNFEALRAKLAAWGFEVGERPNAPLFARGHGVTIHAYRTKKLMISGARADEWARAFGREAAAPRAERPASPAAEYVLHFDGSCMPRNPGGIAAYGFVVLRHGAIVHEGHGVAAPPGPGATNNVAEFAGLIAGLEWIRANVPRGASVLVRGDSDLVISSLRGKKRISAARLTALYEKAKALLEEIGAPVEWVPREHNAEADRMSRVGFAEAVRANPRWGDL